jgi:hypothetical protein
MGWLHPPSDPARLTDEASGLEPIMVVLLAGFLRRVHVDHSRVEVG